MTNRLAGGAPQAIHLPGPPLTIDFDEHCFVQYLPVAMGAPTVMPKHLQAFTRLVNYVRTDTHTSYQYAYLTVKNGWCPAGTHQNREGTHVDGYLSDDENYVYVLGQPTEYIDVPVFEAADTHDGALSQFEQLWTTSAVKTMEPGVLYRLDKAIHQAPLISESHVRLFVKVSLSNSRYNLKGNAHNYDLDYDWEMFDRSMVRNHPTYSNGDSFDDNDHERLRYPS